MRLMLKKGINPINSRILILGLSFKENCPDLRNTRVVDIVHVLEEYNARVDVYDPWVDVAEAQHEYGIRLVGMPVQNSYDAVIVAVGHKQFCGLGANGVRAWCKPEGVLYDVKNVLPRSAVDGRL